MRSRRESARSEGSDESDGNAWRNDGGETGAGTLADSVTTFSMLQVSQRCMPLPKLNFDIVRK